MGGYEINLKKHTHKPVKPQKASDVMRDYRFGSFMIFGLAIDKTVEMMNSTWTNCKTDEEESKTRDLYEPFRSKKRWLGVENFPPTTHMSKGSWQNRCVYVCVHIVKLLFAGIKPKRDKVSHHIDKCVCVWVRICVKSGWENLCTYSKDYLKLHI